MNGKLESESPMIEWNLLTILAVIGACFSLYVLCYSTFRGSAKGLEERMQAFAKQAVSLAKAEHQCHLDYSLDSISLVDRILEKIHARHQDSAIPERELSRIVLTWGGYLGTVLKRNYGGSWQADSSTAGQSTYPFLCNEREAVPVMWCLQRIRHGSSASVVTKTAAFMKLFEEVP